MRVLVADDDTGVLLAIELLLQREGIEAVRATSPEEVLERLERGGVPANRRPSFDAILLDLNYTRDTTSGAEGFTLLSRLRVEHPDVPVVVMTGWGSIEGAVEAMRRGATDYVPKPWDNGRLLALLRGLSPPPSARVPSAPNVRAPAMVDLFSTIEQVAFSDLPVLITGEHGSGKELIARAVHEKSGRRGRFVAVNAGALAEGTFESDLFGHVRGAFTDAKASREGAFAQAEGGTLLLDEVANLPLAQQTKLLRVLQEKQYQPLGASALKASTARVVSATNADIDAMARGGQFRPDLLYRLNTIRLHVPPLRERKEELPGLVRSFIDREVSRYGLETPRLAPGVMDACERHSWPGNVRELEHVIQRAVLLSARSGELTLAHLELPSDREVPARATGSDRAPMAEPQTVRDAEKAAILHALERFPEDRRAAAESLGLSRSAFYRRLSQHGIRPPK